ncbi:MAG TPA: pyruvate kinase [Vicinamibacterales bacterium]|jgi:pyruvate kinase
MVISSPVSDAVHSAQVVATIGPASRSSVRSLADAGATRFRINASHLDGAELASLLSLAHDACPEVPLVVDLQGAKMRLGLRVARRVTAGERVRFSSKADAEVPLPHPEIYGQVAQGDTLTVDDGRMRFEVIEAGQEWLDARALCDGQLLPRKGVNVEQHPIRLRRLSERDRDACRVASQHGVRALAFSFMLDGSESEWLRQAVPGCRVIGKIERGEAARDSATIAARVDEIWICRGDLGAQLGPAALASFVGALDPRQLPVPVLMAGQVLEHLTEHREPTRSEVCHLFDLVSRGYAGIVLSDETAVGNDPVHAVSTAAALLDSFRP